MINNLDKFIGDYLVESARLKEEIIESCTNDIISAANMIITALQNGKKVLICGNGGSAADAQHIAAEFVVRLSPDIKRPGLPAIALTTDSSILTAGGNDFGFSSIFARQVEALGTKSDILLGITTSGNSENILNAAKTARKKEMHIIGLLGGNGGIAKELFNHSIIVPSQKTQHIQEGHITIAHLLCEIVERQIFES